MQKIENEIKKHIKKLTTPLKQDNELKLALKAKLTKKEYKLLECWANECDIDELKAKLHLDNDKYHELTSKLIKKLNQEKTKQEICE
jgi:tRNA G18 (ribose-2'-O)-methylase SpoU